MRVYNGMVVQCNSCLVAIRYLLQYQAIKILKVFLTMINFDEFEVGVPLRLAEEAPHGMENCDHVLHDLQGSNHHTVSSIHEVNILEIEDHYSSIEHSANILDKMDLQEKDFPFADRSTPNCADEENQEEARLRKRIQRRLKNETKNIPKNFGKGIISFIEKNQSQVKSLLIQNGIPFQEFMARMRRQKRIINTIADLRRLWTDPTIGKSLRVISNLFFRRYALHYIFNSRISNFSSHIKYRQSLWEALKHPQAFNHIKQY